MSRIVTFDGMRRAALVLLLCALPGPAFAQLGLAAGSGVDAGTAFTDSDIARADGAPREQSVTSLSLGIDVGMLLALSPSFAMGLTLQPTLFQSGTGPSKDLQFLVGLRGAWQWRRLHLQGSAGFVVSSFNDRCSGGWTTLVPCSGTTRPSEPVGRGFGLTVSPLLRVHESDGLSLLFGPTVRIRRTYTAYTDGPGHITFDSLHVVVGVHGYFNFSGIKP